MAYTFSSETIEEIREKNDIVDVIGEYIDLKRTGSSYKGLCPFHNEKTPSFIVTPSKQLFHCFGCGTGGDVVTFVMKYLNIDFTEALQLLADRVGILINTNNSKKNTELIKKKKKIYQINREAARFYYKNLFKYKKPRKYLFKRGINKEIIKAFGLGYALDSWNGVLNYLLGKGYKTRIIEEAGLIIKSKKVNKYYDRFRNRVVFPIFDTKGNILGFGGRVIDDNSYPKYLNSPETPVFKKGYNLYGLNILKKNKNNKDVILVEGYIDVIALYKYGFKCGVASLGTAFTTNQAKLLKRYAKDIYICYDSDKAGQNATNKVIDILEKENIKHKVIVLPKGRDPDEYLTLEGKKAYSNLISNALGYIDYKIYLYKNKYDINTTEGKIQFSKEISKALKKKKSPVEVDAYIKKIANLTQISENALKKEIHGNRWKSKTNVRVKDKYINGKYRYTNKSTITPVKNSLDSGHISAERNLLKLIIEDKKVFDKAKVILNPDDFYNRINKKIAQIVYKEYDEKGIIEEEALFNYFNKEEVIKVKNILSTDIIFNDREKEKALNDYINKINYYKLKIKKESIKQKLKQIDIKKNKTEGDVQKFNKLCLEIINIEKELKLHQ